MLLATLAILFSVASCTNSSVTDSASTNRNLSVYLTDAPMPGGPNMPFWLKFTAVNLDVKGIQYIGKDSIWKDASFTEAIFNVKMMANGDSALLSKISIPSGDPVRRIRFILGKNNSVVLNNNTEKALLIPFKSDSSIVVRVNENVPSGDYGIMLDFDLASSIVRDFQGDYILIPKLRGFIMECTSTIDGFVLPRKLLTKVFVVNGTDTIMTVSDTLRANYFKLSGFDKGQYTVNFMPLDSGYVTLQKTVTVMGNHDNVPLGNVKVTR